MENDTSLVAKKKMLKNEAMIADTNSSLPNKAENLVHSEERIEPVFESKLSGQKTYIFNSYTDIS